MKCRFCASLDSKVVDSRPTDDGMSIRRRRECINCGKRFTTYEKLEEIPIMVVKKDGRREPFDSEKILIGITKACQKRPISTSEISTLVESIEREVFNSLEQEVPASKIGEMIMKRLKDLDDVAYVRFASVYRHFSDKNAFLDELKSMQDDKND